MTKEQVYDSKIAPLMTQIIAICNEAKIPMIADFALDWSDDDQSHLKSTTMLIDKEWDAPVEMIEASRLLMPSQRSPLMMTVFDGDGNVVRRDAFM